MTTLRQIEANRRNALRSSGPRTPLGKSRSCLNAITHGLTAATVVLPGEDAEEFERRVAGWQEDLRPCNSFEEELVRQAVGHSWRLERFESMELAMLAEQIATVPAEEAARRREAVADLGRRLLTDVRRDWRDGPDDPDDPARLLVRLEATADGCRWLLDRWAEKRQAPRPAPPGRRPRWSRPSACWASGRSMRSATGRSSG